MQTANISEKLVKSYSDRIYKYTAMITHKGTLVAFAMDDKRRILYTVLDLDDTEEGKEEFDVAYWSDNPTELQFPSEIGQVGYSIVGSNRMPTVKVNTRAEVANPSQLLPEEVDRFLSTTARLTADAPFQVFSDQKHIFVFRQAITDDHQDAVYKLKNGTVSGDSNRPDSDFLLSDGNKVPVVDCTLLCDRFVLSGKFLQPNREVRYQRSRHKTNPANQTDSLGAKDMEGNPFFEPTQELAFISNLQHGSFTVLQLPTQVQGVKRWQLFAHNSTTSRIDSFNFEVSDEGLFNLQGTQLYTSPDPQYSSAVLERSPGSCPFTSLPLVPVASNTNYGETALEFDGTGDYVEVAAHANPTTAITVSLWAKSNTDNWNDYGCLASKRDAYIMHPVKDSKTIKFYIYASDTWKSVGHTPSDIKQWHHYAGTFDGKTLKLYIDGAEVASEEVFTETKAINSDSGALYLGKDDNASKYFNGQIDEVRIWNRACSQYEIKTKRSRRLIGNEPGLVGYWRFDEGVGNTVYDQTDNGNNGTIHGNPQWVASDAPIADHPGMRRSSFTLSGRSLVGGLSSRLYFQQEKTASGYDGTRKPMKKNARVMLAAATTQTDGTEPGTATLDFAVSKEGRLAQVPDTINLPVLEKPEASSNISQISTLESEIRSLNDDIEQLDNEIADLSQIVPTARNLIFHHWYKIKVYYPESGKIGGYLSKAEDGTITTSTNPSLTDTASQWKFYYYRGFGIRLINRTAPSQFLRIGIDRSKYESNVLSFNPDISGICEAEFNLLRQDDNRYELELYGYGSEPYWVFYYLTPEGFFLKMWGKSNSGWSKPAQSIQASRDRSSKIQFMPEDITWEELIYQKTQLRTTKQNQLNDKTLELGTLSAGTKTEIRLPMGLIHCDTAGLTVNGALLKFAPSEDTPFMLDSATGEFTLYYRNAAKQFMATYFGTLVSRASFNCPGNSVTLLARAAGSNNATATVSDGNNDDTCNLVITNSDRNITETWNNLPRNPKQFAEILNGQVERPDTVTVGITPAIFNVKERSLQVIAAVSNADGAVSNGDATALPGLDSQWKADAPGRAYYFDSNSSLLSLPNSQLAETAMDSNLTVEAWVNPSPTNDGTARLLHHCSNKAAYTLALQEATSETYHLVAGVSYGTDASHNGQRFLKSRETLPAEEWHHIALRFNQSYGLQFNGKSHLDCGNNQMLDIGEDLTIEAFVQLNNFSSTQGLIGKGFLGEDGKSVPYQFKVGTDRKLEFTFEDADGGSHTYRSTHGLSSGSFHRVAVTRKKGSTQNQEKGTKSITYKDEDGNDQEVNIEAIKSVDIEDWYDITFYIDGVARGVSRYDGQAPLGNDGALEIGRTQASPRNQQYTQGIIAEVRLWNTARKQEKIGKKIEGNESGLVSWWRFEDNEGNVATDSKSSNHGKVKGAKWVKNPDPKGGSFNLLWNGLPMAADLMTSGTPAWGDSQFSLAGYNNGSASDRFNGILEEVRIWRTLRTDEQISDNLFTRLKGEKQDLLAYYTFDDPSNQSQANRLNDNGLRGNHLPLPESEDDRPTIILSTAPISNDTAAVRSALAGVETAFHEQIDSTPAVQEYGDLQRDSQGNMGGVLKRCYSYLQDGQWQLVTGYKVGNLVTEWIGQAQFDPQVIGYIEGTPPVPSENLTEGNLNTSYEKVGQVSNIEFVESETVNYSLSSSKESSIDMGFRAAGEITAGTEVWLITAPLGIGTAQQLVDVDFTAGLQGNFDTSNQWSQEESIGTSINRTRSMSVALGGSLEEAGDGKQLNPAVGRRVIPGNMGFALVQSQTADIFALRLAHNNALVSFRMMPNPDIPIDWNIIPFPINPRYTKQGTLDGRVGYNEDGAIVLDPDYANARSYGEYSYFKPKEAYAIEKRIQREEQRLFNYYQSFDTAADNTGQVIGAAAGAAAGILAGPVGMAVGAAVGSSVGGLADAVSSNTSMKLPQKFAKRNLVNTYVWTADGGFFAETTETTDVKSEVTAGSFSFSGAVGGTFNLNIDAPVGISLEFEASIGGSINITKTRAKDTEKAFSLAVNVDVPGDLQKTEHKPASNKWGLTGTGENAAGKVDAYRFKTFYLDGSGRNFEDLFGKVIDPIWLAGDTPNAIALRQANQGDKKPPCWRIFHRVTFVSRILPEFSGPVDAPLEIALKAENIDSNWQLIQKLDPFVRNHTQDLVAFSDAARNSIKLYLPELEPHSTEIIKYLKLYYGIN